MNGWDVGESSHNMLSCTYPVLPVMTEQNFRMARIQMVYLKCKSCTLSLCKSIQ